MAAPAVPSTPDAIEGRFFDGTTSKPQAASVRVIGSAVIVLSEQGVYRAPLAGLHIEPALGSLPRLLVLPGDRRFETTDHAAVAQLERRLRRNRAMSLVFTLESRRRLALAGLAVVLVSCLAFWQFGLPLAARVAANVTPRAVLETLDRQTLALLDEHLLEPSRLPASTRKRLRARFEPLVREIDPRTPMRLEFRNGEFLGANAFALANGTVVVTDELVGLARNDREVLGVLAHEAGHVRHRHVARSVYQGVGLLMFLSILTGDVTAASTAAGAVGVSLVQNGYSRDMEREADEVAGRYLVQHYGSTLPLRDMLRRLSAQDDELPALLSSHPGVRLRLQHLQALEGSAGVP